MDDADLTDERAVAQARFEARQAAWLQSERQRRARVSCVDCGEPLVHARIALFATRCYDCQVVVDKAAKLFRRSE